MTCPPGIIPGTMPSVTYLRGTTAQATVVQYSVRVCPVDGGGGTAGPVRWARCALLPPLPRPGALAPPCVTCCPRWRRGCIPSLTLPRGAAFRTSTSFTSTSAPASRCARRACRSFRPRPGPPPPRSAVRAAAAAAGRWLAREGAGLRGCRGSTVARGLASRPCSCSQPNRRARARKTYTRALPPVPCRPRRAAPLLSWQASASSMGASASSTRTWPRCGPRRSSGPFQPSTPSFRVPRSVLASHSEPDRAIYR